MTRATENDLLTEMVIGFAMEVHRGFLVLISAQSARAKRLFHSHCLTASPVKIGAGAATR